jgi:heptosyltransferase-2/heptosyltransferase-3
VLLLRPDHLGDVLLTSPAVALLRAELPDAHLTYLVGPWSRVVAERGPAVDVVQTLPFPGFSRRANAHLAAPYTLLARTAQRLRRDHFDLAIVFRPDHWWGALLALSVGIPVRIGSATPETSPLLTHARTRPPDEHAADLALALARMALEATGVATTTRPTMHSAPVYHVPDAARAAAAARWQALGLTARIVVAIQPSAGAPLKSWPVERWASLADALDTRGLTVLLMGGPEDAAVLRAIRARMRSTPAALLAGQPLDDSAALLARCRLLVGLDAGMSHLAGALGIPTIRLYGPASAGLYGPWPPDPRQDVLVTAGLPCVPCGHLDGPPCGAVTEPACLLALGVADVLKAVEAQLTRD